MEKLYMSTKDSKSKTAPKIATNKLGIINNERQIKSVSPYQQRRLLWQSQPQVSKIKNV